MTPGSTIGPYHVIRQLGSGGMGSVWLAEDPRLNRQVALKTVLATRDDRAPGRARLLNEARAAAALTHPHIATVHDVIDANGEIVIVFEYVQGETLASRLRRGPIALGDAVTVGRQMADALSAAHARGIIHRDLKPANVILGADGKAKVLDFGVARQPAADATTTGLPEAAGEATATGLGLVGTPGYAAPEQWLSREIDGRADLYALGVMLFEMVAGRRPFVGPDKMQAATMALNHDAPTLGSIGVRTPAAFESLVTRLVAREPVNRPASAREVLAALEQLDQSAPPLPAPPALRSGPRDVMTVALVLAALAALAVGWLRFGPPSRPDPGAARGAAPPVVAVLPLANISGDPAKEYLAAGIADSLITSLAGLPSVTVLSRAAVAEARTRSPDTAKLIADLGATWLVEGGVQQAGDQLRISVNLVRADRSVAWADSFEGALARIFELQTRLAGAVSEAMTVHASVSGQRRVPGPPTSSPQALTAYWQGRAMLERRDVKGNLAGAIRAFEEATTLDPKFALAHAALGEAYWQQYLESRDGSWAQKAIDEGTAALKIDPAQPEVRYTLAVTLAGSGKLPEAVNELQRALALRSNYDDARRQLGQVLAQQGKIDEAVAELGKAIALRPHWGHYNALGVTLFQAGRFEEAVPPFTRMTELHPDSYVGFLMLGAVYHSLENTDKALANYQRSILVRPTPQAYSNIGSLHHERREYEAAVDSYRKALDLRPNSAATHRNLGDALLKMGREAEARQAYQQAVALAEKDLAVNPTDARSLSALAVYLAKSGDDGAAMERIDAAARLAPDHIDVLSRLAVVHALAGRSEAALDALERALQRGYRAVTAMREEDFETLRQTPRFKALVGARQPARNP